MLWKRAGSENGVDTPERVNPAADPPQTLKTSNFYTMKPNIIPFTDPTAPRAPFEQGSTPRAAWFCIETTFCHDTPQPEAMLHAHGLYAYADEDPLACCTQYGLDKEVATPETLQQLASAFAAQDADGAACCCGFVYRV